VFALIDGSPVMRLIAWLLILVGVAACGTEQTQSEQVLVRPDNEMRQRQVILDTEAILQGMAQARQRSQELARTAR
jgi:hypothetical protein